MASSCGGSGAARRVRRGGVGVLNKLTGYEQVLFDKVLKQPCLSFEGLIWFFKRAHRFYLFFVLFDFLLFCLLFFFITAAGAARRARCCGAGPWPPPENVRTDTRNQSLISHPGLTASGNFGINLSRLSAALTQLAKYAGLATPFSRPQSLPRLLHARRDRTSERQGLPARYAVFGPVLA